jgi:hypothetical protein
MGDFTTFHRLTKEGFVTLNDTLKLIKSLFITLDKHLNKENDKAIIIDYCAFGVFWFFPVKNAEHRRNTVPKPTPTIIE